MRIGVPKEIKPAEYRVALTVGGASEMVKQGHTVFVEKSAGVGSGFSDEAYQNAGATILSTASEVFEQAEMIMKVKEPLPAEYPLIREEQLLFTYFHFASSHELTRAMIDSGAVCLAYETVEDKEGRLPLLQPMSEVAGRLSVQQGAKYLESPQGGKGLLLGGVPGVRPAKVLILGGGVVGTEAAKMAAGLGAEVTIMDISLPRLRYLSEVLPANVITVKADHQAILEHLPSCDLLIGAALVHGAKAPRLITKEMLSLLGPKSLLVDVAIDQGGCFETSRATTHKEPVYEVDNILHYCVANMPGAVPHSSTRALTNATLAHAIELANNGWEKACANNPLLRKGLNIIQGKVSYPSVAEAFQLPYSPLSM